MIWIVGSPFINDQILDKEYYFHILGTIKRYFKKNDNIIYFAHRREKLGELNEIANYFNFKTRKDNTPLELFAKESRELPKVICGCYSAVLPNLGASLKHYDIDIYAFKFDLSKLKRQGLSDVLQEVYHSLERKGIKIIPVNE